MTSSTTQEKKNHFPRFITKINYIIFLVIIAILPLVIIPSDAVSFSYVKVGILLLATIVSLIISSIETIKKGEVEVPNMLVSAAFILIPLISVISALVLPHSTTSLIGNGFEFDTFQFLLMGFTISILLPKVFTSKLHVYYAYLTFFLSFLVLTLIHALRFSFGVNFLHLNSILPTIASNTVGSWNDFGSYVGLVIILSFITLEFIPLSKMFKYIQGIILACGLILLTITNSIVITTTTFSISLAFIIGFIALFTFVYSISLNYKESRNSLTKEERASAFRTKKFPLASLIVLIVCVVNINSSQEITKNIYNALNINAADVLNVRPTFTSTMAVGYDTVRSSIKHGLVGVGNNRFYTAWDLYKPVSVNQTDFWNVDFNYGSGYIPTFFTTNGVLSVIAWLFFLGVIMFYGVKGAFSKIQDRISLYLVLSSFLATIYLWFMAFFTVPGPVMLGLTFIFTGLLFSSLYNEGILKTRTFSWIANQKKGFFMVLVLVTIIIASIGWESIWVKKFIASIYVNEALAAINTNQDVSEGERLMIKAFNYDISDAYLRIFSQIKLVQLQQDFQKINKTELNEKNAVLLNDAIGAVIEAAQNRAPENYQNWVLLGSLYESAGLLGVTQAPPLAKVAYEQARTLNPTNPLPDLLLARLYVYAKDVSTAETLIQQSLAKKENFQQAFDFLNELKNSTVSPTNASVAVNLTATSTTKSSSSTSATSTER